MIRLILFLAGLLAIIIIVACGESEEDRALRVVVAIYSDDVVSQVDAVLAAKGKQGAVPSEIFDACGVWKEAGYRPNLKADTDDDWDRMARELLDWKEDNGVSESGRARLQDVWVSIHSVTNVLQRERGVLLDGEDFCKFMLE